MKQKHAWGLFGKDGEFIAAFRFKPKRVYVPQLGEDKAYVAWLDYDVETSIIRGSENATCKKIAVPKPIKNKT